ncbi:MAG: hypothetical protein QGH60_00415 [Phycisphaerae bacterium]|nr:hypothetical protein [Phycisphaerae bacterium]
MSRKITRIGLYWIPPTPLKELLEATWAGRFNRYRACELVARHHGDCASWQAHATLLDAISIIDDDRQEFIQAMRETLRAYLPIVLRGPRVKSWFPNIFVRWPKQDAVDQLKELRQELSKRASQFVVTESVAWEDFNDLERTISLFGAKANDDFARHFTDVLKPLMSEKKPLQKVHAPNMPLEWYTQSERSLGRLAEGQLPFGLTPHMSVASAVRDDELYKMSAEKVCKTILRDLPKVPGYKRLLGKNVVHEVNDAHIVEPAPSHVRPIHATVLDRISGEVKTERRHLWRGCERLLGPEVNGDPKLDTALLLDCRASDPQEYMDKVVDKIIRPLTGFSRLNILVHAENKLSISQRQDKAALWQEALRNSKTYRKPGLWTTVLYDVEGTPTGPCEDWFKNMFYVFQDPGIQRVLYLPYDICFIKKRAQRGGSKKGLQDFIDRWARRDLDLLLGTYKAKTHVTEAKEDNFLVPTARAGKRDRSDIPKNVLEDFAVLETWTRFPRCARWFSQTRTDAGHDPKYRTGFFAVSRDLYEAFRSRRRRETMLPWAGTVQLLIFAAMCARAVQAKAIRGKTIVPPGMTARTPRYDFKAGEHFVADIFEPGDRLSHYTVREQRERIAFVLAAEAHWWNCYYPELPC